MLIIGLTGGIGSGKTTVSNLFENLGVHVIDTDVIARELVDSDSSLLEEITDTFGEEILGINGLLDRKNLAKIVFSQKKGKQQLEKILHPRIRTEVEKKIQSFHLKHTSPHYIIVVVPLLLETNFHNLIDRILVVTANEEDRINRVVKRDNRSPDDIRAIIDSQATEKERISSADDIINNNNDINELETQVLQLHHKYSNRPKIEE